MMPYDGHMTSKRQPDAFSLYIESGKQLFFILNNSRTVSNLACGKN